MSTFTQLHFNQQPVYMFQLLPANSESIIYTLLCVCMSKHGWSTDSGGAETLQHGLQHPSGCLIQFLEAKGKTIRDVLNAEEQFLCDAQQTGPDGHNQQGQAAEHVEREVQDS